MNEEKTKSLSKFNHKSFKF